MIIFNLLLTLKYILVLICLFYTFILIIFTLWYCQHHHVGFVTDFMKRRSQRGHLGQQLLAILFGASEKYLA